MKLFAKGEELVCQFSPDEDLVGALEGFEGGTFVFDATGALRDIDLEDEEANRRKIGAAHVLTLRGVVSEGRVEIHGTFLRGSQALGGRVWGARVVRCVARGSIFQAASAADHFSPESNRDDAPSPSSGWGAAAAASSAAQSAPAPAPASGGWAAAIAASEAAQAVPKKPRRPRRESAPRPGSASSRLAPPTVRSAKSRAQSPAYLDEPIPQVGEFVDHKQFGICRVQRSLDDALVIKLPTGRTKQIKLTVLEVLEPREDTSRVVYPLRPRKR